MDEERIVKRPRSPGSCERQSKRRCVHFAELASCKLVPQDRKKPLDASHKAFQSTICDSPPSDDVADEMYRILDDSMMNDDHGGCRESSEGLDEFSVLTKNEDGPSAVTLATHALILWVVKHGTITKSEVACTLQASMTPSNANADADADAAPPAGAAPPPPQARAVDPELCGGIQDRLTALSSRIGACGRAALLPSAAVMGKPFMPALDYLRTLVAEVAAEPTAAASAAAAAAAAPTRCPCGPSLSPPPPCQPDLPSAPYQPTGTISVAALVH